MHFTVSNMDLSFMVKVVEDNLYVTYKPCSWGCNLFNSLASFYMIWY